jgi:hypothetical protein
MPTYDRKRPIGVIVPSDVTYSEIVASPGRQALAKHADRTHKVVGHHCGGAQVKLFHARQRRMNSIFLRVASTHCSGLECLVSKTYQLS